MTRSRRRLLQLLGVAGTTAALSGCGGTAERQRERPEDDGGPVLGIGVGNSFQKPAWNLFNPTKDQVRAAQWLFLQPMYYIRREEEWKPGLFADYTVDGTTVTFDVDDRYTWHNGEPVTAEDFVVQYRIEREFDHPTWNYADSIHAPEETTVVLELENPVNQQVLLWDLFRNYPLQSPRFVLGEYAERFADATTDAERESVTTDLTQFRWAEPIGNGPFQFESYASSSEMRASLYEDYPIADEFDFSRAVFRYHENDQQLIAGMVDGTINTRWAIGPDLETVTDRGGTQWELRRWDVPRGRLWAFNTQHKWWGKRDARRGVAYLMNLENILAATPEDSENKRPPAHPTTVLSDSLVERYLQDVTLEDYDPRQNQPEKAAEAFRSAGWSKQDGTWHDENGEEVVFQCRSPAPVTVMNNRIQYLASENEEYGLTSELVTLEGSAYWNDFGQGNFPVQWAGWRSSLPSEAFQNAVAGPIGHTNIGFPQTVTVPEIGDVGGEDVLEVDVDAQMERLATGQTEAEIADAVQTLAWVCNQTVPTIPIYIGEATLPVDTENWNVPPQEDPVWSTPSPVAYIAQTRGLTSK